MYHYVLDKHGMVPRRQRGQALRRRHGGAAQPQGEPASPARAPGRQGGPNALPAARGSHPAHPLKKEVIE